MMSKSVAMVEVKKAQFNQLNLVLLKSKDRKFNLPESLNRNL